MLAVRSTARSSRSTAVAATFWLVVLLVADFSSSTLSARKRSLQPGDFYSANGKLISHDDDVMVAYIVMIAYIKLYSCSNISAKREKDAWASEH